MWSLIWSLHTNYSPSNPCKTWIEWIGSTRQLQTYFKKYLERQFENSSKITKSSKQKTMQPKLVHTPIILWCTTLFILLSTKGRVRLLRFEEKKSPQRLVFLAGQSQSQGTSERCNERRGTLGRVVLSFEPFLILWWKINIYNTRYM